MWHSTDVCTLTVVNHHVYSRTQSLPMYRSSLLNRSWQSRSRWNSTCLTHLPWSCNKHRACLVQWTFGTLCIPSAHDTVCSRRCNHITCLTSTTLTARVEKSFSPSTLNTSHKIHGPPRETLCNCAYTSIMTSTSLCAPESPRVWKASALNSGSSEAQTTHHASTRHRMTLN